MIAHGRDPMADYTAFLRDSAAHLHEFVGVLLAQKMTLESDIKKLMMRNAELTREVATLKNLIREDQN